MTQPLLIVVHRRGGSAAPWRIADAARRVGCQILFVTPDPLSSASERRVLSALGRLIEVDGRVMDDVAQICRGHEPDGIVTFYEGHLRYTAELANALNLPFHSLGDIDAITLKAAQREAMRASGIDVPRSTRLSRLSEVKRFSKTIESPVIVKPSLGAGSRNTVAVSRPEQFLSVVSVMLRDAPGTELVAEELLVGRPTPAPWGDYIAVDCLVEDRKVRPLFIQGKFDLQAPFRERGGFGPPREEPELLGAVCCEAAAAIRSIGITQGIADVELKLTVAGPKMIEVNGRLGAWVDDMSRRSQGIDMVAVAIRSALAISNERYVRPVGQNSDIAFNYILVPPVPVRNVSNFDYYDEIARMPEVIRVERLKDPADTRTNWEDGPDSFVAIVAGAVPDHKALADVVKRFEDTFAAGLGRDR